jgi:hypothetical protein
MSGPERTKLVEAAIVLLVAVTVIVFHLTLWYVFLIFLPLTFGLLRVARQI